MSAATTTIPVTVTTPVGWFDCKPSQNITVSYVFTNHGVKWSNSNGANITITATTIAGSLLTWPTPTVLNSTAIRYHVSAFHGITGDVTFAKQFQTICGKTYVKPNAEMTVCGINSGSPVAFDLVFTNPLQATVTTLSNAFTFGDEGFNYSRDAQFSPSFTSTTLTWKITIPSGSFCVDPATIGTTTAGIGTGFPPQSRLWSAALNYWFFYSDGTHFGYRSCLISSGDCETAATHWGSFTSINTRTANGQCATDINASISATYLYYACAATSTTMVFDSGTLKTTGVFALSKTTETSVTLTHSGSVGANINPITNTSIIVTVSTNDGTNEHLEVWWCQTSSCFTNTNWSDKKDIADAVGLHTIQSTIDAVDSGGKATVAVFWGVQNTAVDPLRIIYTQNHGTSFSSEITSACFVDGRGLSEVTTTVNTAYMVAETTASGSGCTNSDIEFFTWNYGSATMTTENKAFIVPGTGQAGATLTTDGVSELIVTWIDTVTSGSATIKQIKSLNGGGSWTGQGIQAQIVTQEAALIKFSLSASYSIDSSGEMLLGWMSGTTPFNVRFVGWDATAPTIVQTKTCTGTAVSTLACTFTSNTVAGNTIVVIAEDITATAVTSISDTQSLTYTLVVAKDNGVTGDIEGWETCGSATAAADTVTSHYGVSVTPSITIMELTPSCHSSSSTGTGAATTSAAVSSYTPTDPVLVIGGSDSTPQTSTATTGTIAYNVISNAVFGVTNIAISDFVQNLGIAETTPFTFSGAASYNEISMAYSTNTITAVSYTTTLPFSVSYVNVKTLARAYSPTLPFSVSYVNIKTLLRSWSPALPFSTAYTNLKTLPIAYSASLPFSAAYVNLKTLLRSWTPILPFNATYSTQRAIQIAYAVTLPFSVAYKLSLCTGTFNTQCIATPSTPQATGAVFLAAGLLLGMIIFRRRRRNQLDSGKPRRDNRL